MKVRFGHTYKKKKTPFFITNKVVINERLWNLALNALLLLHNYISFVLIVCRLAS